MRVRVRVRVGAPEPTKRFFTRRPSSDSSASPAPSTASSSTASLSTASSSTESACLPKAVAWAVTQWQTSVAAAAPASLAHPPWTVGLGMRRGAARRPSATLYGDEAAVRFVELRDVRPCLAANPTLNPNPNPGGLTLTLTLTLTQAG